MDLLSGIFGDNWANITDLGSEQINVLFPLLEKFNLVCLTLISVLLLISIGAGLVGAANEGKVNNTLFNVFTPIRIIIALSLCTPIPWMGGLSMGQGTFLSLVGVSFSGANAMVATATDYITQNGGTIYVELPKNFEQNSKKFIKNIMYSCYLQEYADNVWDATYNKNGRVALKEEEKANKTIYTYIFSKSDQGHGPASNYGEIEITYDNNNADFANLQLTAISEAIQDAWHLADVSIPDNTINGNVKIKNMDVTKEELYKKLYDDYIQIYSDAIANLQSSIAGAKQSEWDEFGQQVKDDGWLFFGIYFLKQALLQEDVNQKLNRFPSYSYMPFNKFVKDSERMYNPFYNAKSKLIQVDNIHEAVFKENNVDVSLKDKIQENNLLKKLDKIVGKISYREFLLDLKDSNNFFTAAQKYGTGFLYAALGSAGVGGLLGAFSGYDLYLFMFAVIFLVLYLILTMLLPLIPALYWLGLVVEWFTQVLKTIVSIPVLCINISNPLGKPEIEKSWKNLLGVLTLPLIGVISMYMAYIAANIVLCDFFPAYMLKVVEHYEVHVLYSILLFLITAVLLVVFAMHLFLLVVKLPEKIINTDIGSTDRYETDQTGRAMNITRQARGEASSATRLASKATGGNKGQGSQSQGQGSSENIDLTVNLNNDHQPGNT
jgi:hypothetical protein